LAIKRFPKTTFREARQAGSDTTYQRISIAAFLTRPYIYFKPYWAIFDWQY